MNEEKRKKLFAVYLGGKADGCNIELHDVVFVVGTSIEETYPLLAKKWFGHLKGFHMDCYLELHYVDGYEVALSTDPPKEVSEKKLYFINVGAYKPGEFTEYHQNAFYVADSSPEAIRRAMAELCQGLQVIHKDDLVVLDCVSHPLDYDVDDVLEISEVDSYYVSLVPAASHTHNRPIAAYTLLC